MKILFIDDFVPYPPYSGSTWRAYGLLKHLCKRQEVVFFAPTRMPSDSEGIAHLGSIGITVETISKPADCGLGKAVWTRLKALCGKVPTHWVLSWDDNVARAICAAIERHDPDLILVEHLSTCRYYDAFAVGRPLVLGQENVESVLEYDVARGMGYSPRGLLRRREVRKVLAFEKQMMSRMDLVLTVSEVDRVQSQSMAPGARIVTIENGVDLEFFPMAEPADSKTVLLTGTLDYQPNIGASLIMANEVLPRLRDAVSGVKTRIVGRNPVQAVRDLACADLEVIPDVPDIRPYLAEAAVVAVPLRGGSGTRIKILEALAMGKAIVSTRKGAEGLDVRDGYDIVLRDDMGEFADAIARLLRTPDKRVEMGRNARSTAEAKYGYHALALKLEKDLLRLLDRRTQAGAL